MQDPSPCSQQGKESRHTEVGEIDILQSLFLLQAKEHKKNDQQEVNSFSSLGYAVTG